MDRLRIKCYRSKTAIARFFIAIDRSSNYIYIYRWLLNRDMYEEVQLISLYPTLHPLPGNRQIFRGPHTGQWDRRTRQQSAMPWHHKRSCLYTRCPQEKILLVRTHYANEMDFKLTCSSSCGRQIFNKNSLRRLFRVFLRGCNEGRNTVAVILFPPPLAVSSSTWRVVDGDH